MGNDSRPSLFPFPLAAIAEIGGGVAGGGKAFWRHRDHVHAAPCRPVTPEYHKGVIRRLVSEVVNAGHLEKLPELYEATLAPRAAAWIEPFWASFGDIEMEIVDIVAEGQMVAARFVCSGTHTGDWLAHPATGRRFRRVPEVYFFEFDDDGLICKAWSLEDTHRRLQQLGLV